MDSKARTHWLLLATALVAATARPAEPAADFRGRQFIGFDAFAGFAPSAGSRLGEKVLTSPVLSARNDFTELIVSWNAVLSTGEYLLVEARAVSPEHCTRYYQLGQWSTDPLQHPRQSFGGQQDADGAVSTDTLLLRRPAARLQVRLTFGGQSGSASPQLKFLAISLTSTNTALSELPPQREAWGKVIEVPERSQMIYPNGKALCSPTTVSMLLAYWARELKRPELDRTVPDIASAIYDSEWHGTGNWPFNMAYAGSFAGMRAYVTRLSDVSELETWIAKGFPVGLSVDYDRLRAKGPGPNGHLVVLVGFTPQGDPIINDPGTTLHVRKVFPRQNLIAAWACSRNTVYLVYPENATLPNDIWGHWDSPKSRPAAAGSH